MRGFTVLLSHSVNTRVLEMFQQLPRALVWISSPDVKAAIKPFFVAVDAGCDFLGNCGNHSSQKLYIH